MTFDLSQLPEPGKKRLAVRMTPAAQRAVRQGHPWVFDHAIRSVSPQGRPGDLAVVFDDYRRFLAVGLYDPDSPIRVRVLQHGSPATDRRHLVQRPAAGPRPRYASPWPRPGTDGYRLVHGENDGLPGLVIDRYAGTLVIKLYTLAWLPWLLDPARTSLDDVQPSETIVLRLSRDVAAESGRACTGCAMAACSTATRPPRRSSFTRTSCSSLQTCSTVRRPASSSTSATIARGFAGWPPRCRTLNVFAYSGGFSVYAAAGGRAVGREPRPECRSAGGCRAEFPAQPGDPCRGRLPPPDDRRRCVRCPRRPRAVVGARFDLGDRQIHPPLPSVRARRPGRCSRTPG